MRWKNFSKQQIWVIPIVICLLLLLAWLLRWDTETIAGDIYVHDRWVAQWWVVESETNQVKAIDMKTKKSHLLVGQHGQLKEKGIIEHVVEWRQALSLIHRPVDKRLAGDQVLQEATATRSKATQIWGILLAGAILTAVFLYRRTYPERFWNPIKLVRRWIWDKYYKTDPAKKPESKK